MSIRRRLLYSCFACPEYAAALARLSETARTSSEDADMGEGPLSLTDFAMRRLGESYTVDLPRLAMPRGANPYRPDDAI